MIPVDPTQWAWEQIKLKNLSVAEGLVLLAISRHATQVSDGVCWPGSSLIHQSCNVHERYARRTVRKLQKHHRLIRVIPCTLNDRTTTNLFILNIPRERESELLKVLKSARPTAKFNEKLIFADGLTLDFGVGLYAPPGPISPGQCAPPGGPTDPGPGAQAGGPIGPREVGVLAPLIPLNSNMKGKEPSLKDGSIPSVPPVSKPERTEFQKFWGPVEGKLRKNVDPDVFASLYAGIRIVDMNASNVVVAVPQSLIRTNRTIEATIASLTAKIESADTNLLRGRKLVVVSLDSLHQETT